MVLVDNGIGFDKSEKNNRSGLNNMKRRAEDLQGKIKVSGEVGQGTSVILTIPYPFQIRSF